MSTGAGRKQRIDGSGKPIGAGLSRGGNSPGTVLARLTKALDENPDYVSLAEAARLLKRGKSTVWEFHSDIESIVVDGIRLYKRSAVMQRARERPKVSGSRITVTGIEVERLQRICEVYYRTQYDVAPTELKRLAKRIARV